MAKKFILILVISIAMFMLGRYTGHYRDDMFYRSLLSDYDRSQVIALEKDIKLLRQLRTGKIDAAETLLESFVDGKIEFLDQAIKINAHDQQVHKECMEALIEAKRYRMEYPEYQPTSNSKWIAEIFQNISS